MEKINKRQLLEQILENEKRKLVLLVQSAFQAKEDSTNEESKAENKYDTRGLEASYLASGQAKRAQDLQEQIFNLEKINLKSFGPDDEANIGAVIELLIEDVETRWVFLLPYGGIETKFGDINIQSLTIDSPLGQHVYNQVEGDDFQLNGKTYEINRMF